MKRFNLILVSLFALMLTSCEEVMPEINLDKNFPVTINDTVIAEAPKAVISLSPNITETIFELGYDNILMGVDDHCDYSPVVSEKLRCGDAVNPNKDNIFMRPCDLIISSAPLSDNDKLIFNSAGIPTLVIPPADSLEGILDNTVDIAAAIGGNEDGRIKGEEYADSLREMWEDSVSITDGLEHNRAIILKEMSYFMATGETVAGEMLREMGFVNEAEPYENWIYPKEKVRILEPDYIFVSDHIQPATVENSYVYSVVAAAKHHCVMPIDFRIIETQSPRIFGLMQDMANFARDNEF